jgi:hypothetical protein
MKITTEEIQFSQQAGRAFSMLDPKIKNEIFDEVRTAKSIESLSPKTKKIIEDALFKYENYFEDKKNLNNE